MTLITNIDEILANYNEPQSMIKNILYIEEGFRAKPYYCTEGFPTIGIGFVVGKKGEPLPDMEMTKRQAFLMLDDKIESFTKEVSERFPIEWSRCNQARKDILISMAFQLGVTGLSKFKNTLAAIRAGNFQKAADEMLDSRWARQTRNRAVRHSNQMLKGYTLEYYINSGVN